MAAAPSVAVADPPLRVRIDESSLIVPPSLLENGSDIDRNRPVTVRNDAGITSTDHTGGTSALRLLQLLDVPAPAVTQLEVQQGVGRTVMLTGDEVRGGFAGDPLCDACQATFDPSYGSDGTVSFFRPLRGNGDANARDNLTPASYGPGRAETLYIRISTDRPRIGVNISVSDQSPRPGDVVQFAATEVDGTAASYTWFFGDGTTATGPTATHQYIAGRWVAGLIAHTGDRYGAASVTLNVVDPTADPKNDTSAATLPDAGAAPSAKSGSGGSGGGSGAGGGTGGKDAPSDGVNASKNAGSNASASKKGRGTSANGSAAPATTPARAAPAPPTATAPAVTPPAAVAPSPAPRAARGTTQAPPGAATISGRLVEPGTRAASLAAALTAADALAREQPAPSSVARSGASGGRSIVGSAASGMLLVGLLAAGAARELRRARHAPLLP